MGVGTVVGGVARTDTLILPAGLHSLRAVYGGGSGGTYLPNQSSTLPYAVTAVPGAGFVAAASPSTGTLPAFVAREISTETVRLIWRWPTIPATR